jgi:hypothetical protein
VAVFKLVWVNATTLLVENVDISNDRYAGYRFDRVDPDPIPTEVGDGTVIRVYYVLDVH